MAKKSKERIFNAVCRALENDSYNWVDEFGDFHDLGEDASGYIMSINREFSEYGESNFSINADW